MMTTTWRMTMTKLGAVVAMLTLAPVLSFDGAAAQSAAVSGGAEVERADLLAEHGRQLAKFHGDYAQASRYLRVAAELRGGDAIAVKELLEAGHLSYYGGEWVDAMYTLASAGRMALKVGDAATAAEAYLDAAWVAHRAGKEDVAREFLITGEDLIDSGVVSPEDRASLRSRIGQLK
jgi:hypothetical protein